MRGLANVDELPRRWRSGGRLGGLHDFGEGDWLAIAAFAFVGGFHEGEEFEGFVCGDGRFT
jgi:hypothetical protein